MDKAPTSLGKKYGEGQSKFGFFAVIHKGLFYEETIVGQREQDSLAGEEPVADLPG